MAVNARYGDTSKSLATSPAGYLYFWKFYFKKIHSADIQISYFKPIPSRSNRQPRLIFATIYLLQKDYSKKSNARISVCLDQNVLNGWVDELETYSLTIPHCLPKSKRYIYKQSTKNHSAVVKNCAAESREYKLARRKRGVITLSSAEHFVRAPLVFLRSNELN